MNFFETSISKKAISNAVKALKSGWISAGKCAEEFESRLERDLGLINPVTLNSGTSSLHLGLVVCGVGPGDEVIIPAQTFVATGLVVLMQGAKPVFADIDPRTGNISPRSIEKKITKNSKAIIPVHWGGYPCDMDDIGAIAKRHNLAVIEDAAQAVGASFKKKAIGALSRFTAFSFQAVKQLTSGDGGALCCLYKRDAVLAKKLRWFGIDRVKAKPSLLGERLYDISKTGYKYHLNDLQAAVGLGNLAGLRARLERRRRVAMRYRNAFKRISGIKPLDYKKDRESSYFLFTVLVEKRKDFICSLLRRNIPASVVHLRIDRNSVFGGVKPDLVGQEKFDCMQVSLPIHEKLSDNDVSRVIKAVKSGW
ncbi:MAG: DegT/DnrJ/EryC1/StrS family aminotransferase [Omnitrophica bacterium]|nr:DegT/DnrJ/EryC1/StrS family aminotransferase [Candidatus Omnitrophota bacterium]